MDLLIFAAITVGFTIAVAFQLGNILQQIRSWRKYISDINKFPGPKTTFIFGSSLEYVVPRADLPKVFDKRYKLYGSAIRVWTVTNIRADIFISKPEFLEVLLSTTKHIQKGDVYKRLKFWLGTGLLTSTGTKWQLHRKLITPAFHFNILEDFFSVFVEKTNILVKLLEDLGSGPAFDLMPFLTRCTLDIICETAMGMQMNIQEENKYKNYVNAVFDLSELTAYRELRPWLFPDFVFYNTPKGRHYTKCLNIAHELTRKVIKVKKLEKAGKIKTVNDKPEDLLYSRKKLALLDLLLETQDTDQPMSDSDIQEEVDTFMFEGHDTTAMGITWTLYMLGQHPHIQDKVFKEQEHIFGMSDRDPTTEDLHTMKYLERVIKETLRLYPSVPFIGRYIEEDIDLGKGLIIPAGTNVAIDIGHTHRDPAQYPDPDTFNPDNFLPERARLRHPYAYIPFSAGPRNCIGQKFALMEEKTVVSKIIRKFNIECDQEAIKILEVTTKPLNGLLVKLTPRQYS